MSIKHAMKSKREEKKKRSDGDLADLKDVRPCHSSLSLKMNGRMMTRLGVIPEMCKARREQTFGEEYLCYSFMLILCGKQLHLYSERRA